MLTGRYSSSPHPMRDALMEAKAVYDDVASCYRDGSAKIISDAEAAPKDCRECARKEVACVREICGRIEGNCSDGDVDLEDALDALQKSRSAFEKLRRARNGLFELHMKLERQIECIRRAGSNLSAAVNEHRRRVSKMEE